MRKITRGASANSGLIFHVFVQDSTSTAGAGKASIAYSSFSCRYIRNGEAISGAITPEDITTIGTYAAPTANTNVRIKAVDNTNMIGVYEVHIHADWVNTTNSCQSLTILLSASGAAPVAIQVPLIAANLQDTVRLGLTALPNAAADAAGGLVISDAGGLDADAQRADVAAILVDTAEIGAAGAGLTNINLPNQTMDIVGNITGNVSGSVGSVTGNVGGNVTGSVTTVLGNVVGNIEGNVEGFVTSVTTGGITAASFAANAINAAALAADAVTEIQSGLATPTNITAGTITTVTNLTNLPAITAGWLTATGIAADAITSAKVAADVGAEIADAVWDEATAGHATAGTTGKALTDAGAAGNPWSALTASNTDPGSFGLALGGGGGGASAASILAYDGSGVVVPDYCLLSMQRLMLNKKLQRAGFIDVYMEDGTTVAFSVPITTAESPAVAVVETGVLA